MVASRALHDTLEHYFKVGKTLGMRANDVAKSYWPAFERAMDEEEGGNDWQDTTPGSLTVVAERVLTEYINSHGSHLAPLEVEWPFALDTDPPLVGSIDLVSEWGGREIVVDYKLQRRAPRRDMPRPLQLSLYSLARPDARRLELHALTASRSGVVVLSWPPPTPAEQEGLALLVEASAAQIEAGVFAPTGMGTWACEPGRCLYRDWCSYSS